MNHRLPLSDQIHALPRQTKKQRAAALLAMLERGPSFGAPGAGYTPQQAAELYRLWVDTWILSELKDLVPQLTDAAP